MPHCASTACTRCWYHHTAPTLLAHAPVLSVDIVSMFYVPETDWKSHTAHQALPAVLPKPMMDYISRIQHLSDDATAPAPLLAHSYVC